MKARERGAKIIHIDPHYSRTSSLSDLYVPIRAGSDIAFLGGLIRHIIETESYFRDYVVHYTNAGRIIREEYKDAEDLDGLFSGFDEETGTYDRASWMFEGDEPPDRGSDQETQSTQAFTDRTAVGTEGDELRTDPTLEHPRCVFQILRRHYARYTPEMVERICGVPRDVFLEVADSLIANSGRERTTMLVYAVGWTQHTAGVQTIRAGSIVQLLLGNVGRPGGGIMAMRGHASIQGSSDIPTLYEILPGYLPTPRATEGDQTLADYVDVSGRKTGWWAHFDKYIVSLLKAWFGDAATAENDFGFGYLPKLTGNHSHFPTMLRAIDGGLDGLLVMGQNPAVGSIHSGLQRRALASMKWLVVRDLADLETAHFWRDSPEIRSGEHKTEEIATEVFLMPCAGHVEKEGHFTNTQRLLQWRDKALDPPGDARSELHFAYHLGKRIKAHYANSERERDWPIRNLTWDYPEHGPEREPSADAVLREINGYDLTKGELVNGFAQLKADGSTACGCWIYSGCYAERRQPDAPAQRRRSRRAGRLGLARVGLGLAHEPAHPLQPRLRRSGRQAVVGAQEVRLVGRGAGEVDGLRRARHAAGAPARSRPAAGRRGHGRAARRLPVHHDAGRQGVAVQSQRPARRAAADALRAARVAAAQRALSQRRLQPGRRHLRPAREPPGRARATTTIRISPRPSA